MLAGFVTHVALRCCAVMCALQTPASQYSELLAATLGPAPEDPFQNLAAFTLAGVEPPAPIKSIYSVLRTDFMAVMTNLRGLGESGGAIQVHHHRFSQPLIDILSKSSSPLVHRNT